jgi:hypothetical protein
MGWLGAAWKIQITLTTDANELSDNRSLSVIVLKQNSENIMGLPAFIGQSTTGAMLCLSVL